MSDKRSKLFRNIIYGLIFSVAIEGVAGISTKLQFDDDDVTPQQTGDDSDDDVEVKHTIVVSTKLKNNRAGIHAEERDGTSPLTQNIELNKSRKKSNTDDEDDVPVVKGYKSVGTTLIRNPSTWYRPQEYPESRNEYPTFTMYPEIQTHILDSEFYNSNSNNQWKPSSFFNNINLWNNDDNHYNTIRRNNIDQNKFHRTIADKSVKEFYCNKCREMSKGFVNDCGQYNYFTKTTTTTPKNKIDGKLLKLN